MIVSDEPNVFGSHPSVSNDGRWVVFEGLPRDGSADGADPQRTRTIWLRDRAAALAPDVELTVAVEGVEVGDSVRPTISGDGCSVAFVTQSGYDLFRDDDGGERWDVYRLVLPHCDGQVADFELVSTQSGFDGDTRALDRVASDEAPAVSQSGAIVAFTHLVTDDDKLQAVTVVDLSKPLGDAQRSNVVAGTPLLPPDTTFRYLGQRQPDVSNDGRFVAFTSDATSAASVPEWGLGPVDGDYATSQVFVWDRATTDDAVQLASAVDGVPAEFGAAQPVISGNGQFVAFESASPDLAGDAKMPPCGTICATQVYRSDQVEGSIVLVSREQTEVGQRFVAADSGATQPTISDDGSQVGFVTRARNLFVTQSAGGTSASDGDIVVSEVDRGIVRRINTLPDGVTPAAGANAHPVLSASGHVVVFDSVAASEITGIASGTSGRNVLAVNRTAVLSAASLDVGSVGIAFPGPEWYVAIRNEGPSTFVPSTVESTNPEFAITGGTCGLGLPVAPGQSCTVYVVLTPAAAGPRRSLLKLVDTSFGGTSVTSSLFGAGGEPALDPTFSGLDFPATPVGRFSAALSSDIVNIGFAPTNITRITVAGDHPDDFQVVDNGCFGQPVNPGSTCTFGVSFTPTEAGHRTATVLVFTDIGQYTAVLVNGDGTRTARIETAESSIRAGDDLGIGASGFRPDTAVTITWADGRGSSITVQTNETGGFLVILPTQATDAIGVRTLVAQSGDQVAKVDVDVLRNPRVARQQDLD
jgi:Tol biopolymer transport system component